MKSLEIPQAAAVKDRLAGVMPGTPSTPCIHCGKPVHVTRELIWTDTDEGAKVQAYVTVAVECPECRSAA